MKNGQNNLADQVLPNSPPEKCLKDDKHFLKFQNLRPCRFLYVGFYCINFLQCSLLE